MLHFTCVTVIQLQLFVLQGIHHLEFLLSTVRHYVCGVHHKSLLMQRGGFFLGTDFIAAFCILAVSAGTCSFWLRAKLHV